MEDSTSIPMEQRRFEGPLARELEEMTLIAADLEVAYQQICLYFAPETKDPVVKEALFNSAVILFTACFDRDNKYRLDPSVVYAGVENVSEFMSWIWGIRNSHVAHTFGATRQAQTVLFINALPPRLVEGAGALALRYAGFGDEEAPGEAAETIKPWAIAFTYAEQKANELRSQVLEEAQKLSRDELDQLDPISFLTPPTHEEIAALKSRGKFGRLERIRQMRQGLADRADQTPQTSSDHPHRSDRRTDPDTAD